mmetsp:Transcript_15128/g.34843  ORF Transcript_15128/g.34843 Transcript_15128/m.34843 type:complete len:232 (+) Transcript_15128:515-1210(+)
MARSSASSAPISSTGTSVAATFSAALPFATTPLTAPLAAASFSEAWSLAPTPSTASAFSSLALTPPRSASAARSLSPSAASSFTAALISAVSASVIVAQSCSPSECVAAATSSSVASAASAATACAAFAATSTSLRFAMATVSGVAGASSLTFLAAKVVSALLLASRVACSLTTSISSSAFMAASGLGMGANSVAGACAPRSTTAAPGCKCAAATAAAARNLDMHGMTAGK